MQDSLETTLSQLVEIPSVSSNAEACHMVLEFVYEHIKNCGFFITRETNSPNPWFIATTKDTKEPDILLAAHLDVVPGDASLFLLKKENGKLKGRGTYDMKLAAACYLELIKNQSASLVDLNIGFLFTTDEEIGGPCMSTILESGLRPKVVFIPDGGDNWHIEERAKGLYGIELTASGKTAHGSRPWEGDNALHTLHDVIAVLRQAYPGNLPHMPTLAVNELHAGTAINQIADYATAKIDFRSFKKEEFVEYKALLDTLVQKYNLTLEVTQSGEPVTFDKESPYVQKFLTALKDETKQPIVYCESYGASDARFFAEYSIPSIVMEPHGGGRHGPDEWLLTEDLAKYYRVIERWVVS